YYWATGQDPLLAYPVGGGARRDMTFDWSKTSKEAKDMFLQLGVDTVAERPPCTVEQMQVVGDRLRAGFHQITARGGKVVMWLETAHPEIHRALEQKCPRAMSWDVLVERTKGPGVTA